MMADLISRQAAIDAVLSYMADNEITDSDWHADGIAYEIKRLPSAQRTGRWIDGKVKHIENGELRNVRECSECGSSYFVYDYYNSVDEIPKFCPNCGCAMKGEEE